MGQRKLVVTGTATGLWLMIAVVSPGGAQLGLVVGGSRANFGALSLEGGFNPSPIERAVVAGGRLDARIYASPIDENAPCRGTLSRLPDLVLDYENPGAILSIVARGGANDTTLVVHPPGRRRGRFVCDDDGAGGSDPRVQFSPPSAGHYDIWVGSYQANQTHPVRLLISEEADAAGIR